MVVSKFKKVMTLCLVAVLAGSFTGCSDAKVEELKNIGALNGESEFAGVNMSVTEKEAAVYAQVSDRTLLDLTALAEVSENDKQAVLSYMDSVDAQLCGTLDKRNGVIDECYTNYLLMEFEKTPYYWQRAQTKIMGMDSASRSIVIDVTYKTIDFKKEVQKDSSIVKGEPNYDQLLSVRYDRWIDILDMKYGYGDVDYEATLAEFERVYGDPEEIIESQRDSSLTDMIYETGNQKTYSELIDSDIEQIGATMTVRYVLVPKYTLGINQGYSCRHMYVTNYALNSDPTNGLQLYTEEDCAAVASSVYDTLYRYYICKDENNFSGLYKLTDDFAGLDKYYEDLFDTSYRKHDNFDLSIFSIQGTKIECGVSVSSKVRAKGSNITFPIYTDRYYYTIELVDGGLQITNEVLLSRVIEGEPAINTDEISTTGFTSNISLSNADKREIENLIANLGAQQLLNDTASDKFNDLIDMSLSQGQVDSIKKTAKSVTGVKKAVWIVSYLQGQSNYASVKCKELYQANDNAITEATATYNFIYKGGKWYIYDYFMTTPVRLDTTELTTKNALCVCSAGKVDSLVSQTGSVTEDKQEGEAASVITVDHDEYKPTLKDKSEKTGYALYEYDKITSDEMNKFIESRDVFKKYNEANPDKKVDAAEMYGMLLDASTSVGMNVSTVEETYKKLAANYHNYIAGYISESEYKNTETTLTAIIKSVEAVYK